MIRRVLFSVAFILVMIQSSPVSAKSFMRCGRDLVEIGDHKIDVYITCGKPDTIDFRTKIIGSTLHHPRRTLDLYQYEEIEVEEWVYNFGPTRFQQYLRFENGRLIDIQDLNKGY